MGAKLAHCEAYVGTSQRGRIIDTVASHRSDTVFALQRFYGIEFVGRQQVAADTLDTRLLANGITCGLVIAGEHRRNDT